MYTVLYVILLSAVFLNLQSEKRTCLKIELCFDHPESQGKDLTTELLLCLVQTRHINLVQWVHITVLQTATVVF